MATRSRHAAASGLLVAFIAPVCVAAGFAMGMKQSLRDHARTPIQRFRTSQQLRKALAGQTKRAVLRALGTPSAAADPRHAGRAMRSPDRATLTSSDLWYYPALAEHGAALAVHFEHGRANDFEFFQSGIAAVQAD